MPSQSAATLRSRYVEQAASDLEQNRRRQQELSEKIKMLQQEESLLVDILNLAKRFERSSDAPSLPGQTQAETARDGAGAVSEAAEPLGGATGRPATGARTQPRRADQKAAGRGISRQPLLGRVLMDLLATHDGPRLAKELRDELLEKHPDRTPTPQVVRNTLESLVAKGRIQRHKQKRSVMYSLVERPQRKIAANPSTDKS
ncbi:hypothetical protein ACFYY2_02915 [Streptomyces sp. NPDC001822]|uniref:hypothetical protein n=1 Tax=Streptomyces sp. NPDC001822 TaxID=3364614 RepID=UPI003690128F